ncbi:MAG: metallophosphoesterase family protein [Pseudomonadota bacterium]
MKILAFSDLHHNRAKAEALVAASRDADLVIGAGDFCNHRQGLPEAMNLLAGIEAPLVVVPGNAESADELRDAAHKGTTVLHGDDTEIDGVTFFGMGYAVPETPFKDWSCDLSESEADAMLSRCEGADIMVLHSPPKNHGDRTSTGLILGSIAIATAIERIQPTYAVFGHIHDSWGYRGKIGRTQLMNLGPTPNWIDL